MTLTKALQEASFVKWVLSLCAFYLNGHCIYCESKLSAIFSAVTEYRSVKPFVALNPGFSLFFFIFRLSRVKVGCIQHVSVQDANRLFDFCSLCTLTKMWIYQTMLETFFKNEKNAMKGMRKADVVSILTAQWLFSHCFKDTYCTASVVFHCF